MTLNGKTDFVVLLREAQSCLTSFGYPDRKLTAEFLASLDYFVVALVEVKTPKTMAARLAACKAQAGLEFLAANGGICFHEGFQLPVLLGDLNNFLWVNKMEEAAQPRLIIRGISCMEMLPAARARFVAFVRKEMYEVAERVRSDFHDRLRAQGLDIPEVPGKLGSETHCLNS